MSFIDQAADGVIDEAQKEERQKLTKEYDFNNLGASQRLIANFSVLEVAHDSRDDSPASGLGADHASSTSSESLQQRPLKK